MKKPATALTLLELLISIILLAIISLALTNVDLFSRFHVISSDRRAKIQNEVSFLLDHMAKQMLGAVGDINQPPVDIGVIGTSQSIRVWVDTNGNGMRDDATIDKQIAYVYDSANYRFNYYANYTDFPAVFETITQKVIQPDFTGYSSLPATPPETYKVYNSANNYVDVFITACWDPDETPFACGSPDNPTVVMQSRIMMPSVSTH
ncbi:MAG: hypothetical protein FJZ09_03165 [Candidatus Omnitrophica bacterium]|nr:hypothetical protein [Candidatus Omnitrophota bacterium]